MNIFWTLFAWLIGLLFIWGGVDHIFFEKLPENEQYNELFGVFAIFLGVTILFSWYKQFKGKKND